MSKTKLFAKSKHLHQVSVDDGQIVWHSLTGSPTHLSDGAVDFLNSFDPCRSALTLDNEESNYLSTLGSLGFIIPYGTNERELFQKQVERSRLGFDEGESLVKNLSLVLTDGCNFACRYCIHFASLGCKQLPNKTNVMAEVDAYRALIVYHNELRRNGSSKARINFGGGEPLLAFDLIKAIVERVEAEFGSDFDHEFTLNTNASLVTDAMSSFFAHHNFLIATSLDGLPDVSDTVRVFGDGSPASSAIIEGITRLRDAGNVIDGVAATLTEQNLRLMGRDFIDWSRDQGMTDIRIDIDVVGMVNIPNAEIVAKLTDLRRYGIGEGVDVYGFWSRPAENLNGNPAKDLIAFCGASLGSSVCISPEGEIKPCGYSQESFGNVGQLSGSISCESGYKTYIRDRLPGNIDFCTGCEIEAFCAGGCNITRECDDEKHTTINRMCDLYRAMTRELLKEQVPS